MAIDSKIEWTHHTANLWWGCTKVHKGCDRCYAETLSRRWNRDIWGNDKPRLEIKSVWKDLVKYQKLAAEAGEMHRVFVGSMMDIFEKPMPLIDSKGNPAIDASDGSPVTNEHIREMLFDQITDGFYPNLIFLFLTKRPSNINKYIPEAWRENPPANVMFGTSPVNQETANKLIPQLLQVKGMKFLSCEPLLGPIDLTHLLLPKDLRCWHCDYELNGEAGRCICGVYHNPRIHWLICGGESGHGARPVHPDWARSLRDQCADAGIPFFFKQWGEWWPGEKGRLYQSRTVDFTDGQPMVWVGKKAAGRILDGRTYDEFPNVFSTSKSIIDHANT